ncbi:MAG: hypothetical protein HYY30_06730 [Chloroflexi bacterium]|nr:hypothetical protein [Chloroflexota bacterium]
MTRTIGLVLGALMLLNGISDTANPRFGFRLWERGLSRYLPEQMNRVTREYSRLSDTSLRYISVWEIVLALLVLWLAIKARD